MLTLEVTITGKTETDLLLALDEVGNSIDGGNTSAMGSNEDGSFTFSLDGEAETPENQLAGRRFIVRYEQEGHEHEYCINVEGFSATGPVIPQTLAEELFRLTELPVLNRGSRLEVVCDDIHYEDIVGVLEDMGLVNDPGGRFLA